MPKNDPDDYGLDIDELPLDDVNPNARSWAELTPTQRFLYSLIQDDQAI